MKKSILALSISILLGSCEKFLDTKLNQSLTTKDLVFSDDISATSAIHGIYYEMVSSGTFTSNYEGMCQNTGLSSDELFNYRRRPERTAFETHDLMPAHPFMQGMWNPVYNVIYQANSMIEGIEKGTGLTPAVASQLKGEALFVRAFAYFYLVNLFGDVPLILETDYHKNSLLPRTSADKVKAQVLSDLLAAQAAMNDAYPVSERARPNKATATAMLARVYLYLGDWENAALQATAVIEHADYGLEQDVAKVFLKESRETIWQLVPVSDYISSPEARWFVLTGTPSSLSQLVRPALLNAFENGDDRRTNWIGSFTNSVGTFIFPYKYKTPYIEPGKSRPEYSIVLRLPEQYLIRAEARAHLNDVSGARSDLDSVRRRAGLGDTQAADPSALLLAIEQERRVELFTEGCHRWFDLKRTGRAITVLGGGIEENDLLYPVPQSEFLRNPKLGEQNAGY